MAWIDPTAAIRNWFGHQQANCKDRQFAVKVDNLQVEFAPKVKPEAATAVVGLLMTGVRRPETC
jgi:hypothetical protein